MNDDSFLHYDEFISELEDEARLDKLIEKQEKENKDENNK